MDKKYNKNKNVTSFLQFHLAFSTRATRKVFRSKNIALRMQELLFSIAKEKQLEIKFLEVHPNHIKLTVALSQPQSPSEVVQSFKGGTQRIIKEFEELYAMQSLWTRKYFISTEKHFPYEAANEFIEEQMNSHKNLWQKNNQKRYSKQKELSNEKN
ncbi:MULTISPECIES: IS200/IS605 family transposase [unclassified Enterococcus]|uniref:IS200/IS605 family transposase n=1 Tax=unclassified Enterococcus TaxID=2608891 RepID=UPI0013EC8219|nr:MULTISPECIES: IS200/IS605 family transposase [unclassified Enterococcus]